MIPDKCKKCGGSTRVTVWRDAWRNYYGVVCESCGLVIGGFDTVDEAVDAWNAQTHEGAMYDRANPTVGMNPDGSPRTDGLYRNRGTGSFSWPEKSA